MQPFIRTVRAAAWAALWLLFPGVLWAQGTSPWVEAVNELQAQFTGPIARGLSLIAIVVGGLMFAFGEGGSKRTLAGIIFGLGDGDGRGELPGLGCSDAGFEALGRLCGAGTDRSRSWAWSVGGFSSSPRSGSRCGTRRLRS